MASLPPDSRTGKRLHQAFDARLQLADALGSPSANNRLSRDVMNVGRFPRSGRHTCPLQGTAKNPSVGFNLGDAVEMDTLVTSTPMKSRTERGPRCS
jgi:hypothetical protein